MAAREFSTMGKCRRVRGIHRPLEPARGAEVPRLAGGPIGAPLARRRRRRGCATAAILARGEPGSIVGVDPSEPLLTGARAEVVDPKVRFEVARRRRATSLGAGEVDVVVSALVMNFVPDVPEALAEARRVVHHGGLVESYVWDYAEGMQFVHGFWTRPWPSTTPHDRSINASQFATTAGATRSRLHLRGTDRCGGAADRGPDGLRRFRRCLDAVPGRDRYGADLSESLRNPDRDGIGIAPRSVVEEPDGSIRLAARAWAMRGRSRRWSPRR